MHRKHRQSVFRVTDSVSGSITEKHYSSVTWCLYLLVEICWPSESACTVADAGLTAADWDTVVLGFFKPTCVPPVRIVVDPTAVELSWRMRPSG